MEKGGAVICSKGLLVRRKRFPLRNGNWFWRDMWLVVTRGIFMHNFFFIHGGVFGMVQDGDLFSFHERESNFFYLAPF
jgi:hypothetical protein